MRVAQSRTLMSDRPGVSESQVRQIEKALTLHGPPLDLGTLLTHASPPGANQTLPFSESPTMRVDCACSHLARSKFIEVQQPRTEKLQEVQVLALAGLQNAQENQVGVNRVFGVGSPHHSASRSEELDGVLRIIVVPRYAIVVQKDEELILVLKHSFLVFSCQLRSKLLYEQVFEVPFDIHFMLIKIMTFQAESVNRVNDWPENGHKFLGQLL